MLTRDKNEFASIYGSVHKKSKAAFTPDTCRRIQVLSSVLLADTSG